MGEAKGYRSTHLNEVIFEEDGSIKPIAANNEGVGQVKTFDPYARTAAALCAWNAGILTELSEGAGAEMVVTDIDSGDWIGISKADFGAEGASAFSATVRSVDGGGAIELRLDRPDGELIGTLAVQGGRSDWTTVTVEVADLTGIHDVFFVFTGKPGTKLFNLKDWQFT